jgi:hypothetical protein
MLLPVSAPCNGQNVTRKVSRASNKTDRSPSASASLCAKSTIEYVRVLTTRISKVFASRSRSRTRLIALMHPSTKQSGGAEHFDAAARVRPRRADAADYCILMIAAVEGTPFPFTTKSM